MIYIYIQISLINSVLALKLKVQKRIICIMYSLLSAPGTSTLLSTSSLFSQHIFFTLSLSLFTCFLHKFSKLIFNSLLHCLPDADAAETLSLAGSLGCHLIIHFIMSVVHKLVSQLAGKHTHLGYRRGRNTTQNTATNPMKMLSKPTEGDI